MTTTLLAHGIGGVRDLPVPEWMFSWGAAAVLLLSFLALGTLWRSPLLAARAPGRPLPDPLSRLLLGRPLRLAAQAASAALLGLVFATALAGEPDPTENLAPTFVWVVFWLGLVPVTVIFGDLWRVLSPWRAVADLGVRLLERGGREARPLLEYPERLGRWPAAGLLFCFAALELAYREPSSPRALALAIALYSYVTWTGMAVYGRKAWLRGGEAFSVYFGLLARISPLAVRDGKVVARMPLSGLAGAERTPGTLAFVAVMLGSVAFDGVSRSSSWVDLVARVEGPYVLERPGLAEALVTGLSLLGLAGGVGLVAGAYLTATAIARRTVNAAAPLADQFLLSLVPIALVYAVAHYFSLLVVQGQFALPLASDPFGRGWDLLGAAGVQPSLNPLAPNTVWYVQVGALVGGHVAGLAVAHDRAIAAFTERGPALRSQYAMLGLMVLYTVGGLWLLSRG